METRTIFEKAVNAVTNGEKFKVNLEKRNLQIGDEYFIKNGKYDGVLYNGVGFSISTFEELYQIYKHSRPSERSENKQRKYFKALKLNELEEDDMLYGDDRELAQLSLELYLLCWILSGTFVWDEESMGKWFWQSQNDKDLVILRSWIDGK
jgi:hypothetical protein